MWPRVAEKRITEPLQYFDDQATAVESAASVDHRQTYACVYVLSSYAA